VIGGFVNWAPSSASVRTEECEHDVAEARNPEPMGGFETKRYLFPWCREKSREVTKKWVPNFKGKLNAEETMR
jgi:hypothetical protein